MPPAMRKAGIEMPTKLSTASPSSPKRVRSAVPISEARIAMARRCAGVDALRQRDEERRQADRVDDDEERHEGGDVGGEIGGHGPEWPAEGASGKREGAVQGRRLRIVVWNRCPAPPGVRWRWREVPTRAKAPGARLSIEARSSSGE